VALGSVGGMAEKWSVPTPISSGDAIHRRLIAVKHVVCGQRLQPGQGDACELQLKLEMFQRYRYRDASDTLARLKAVVACRLQTPLTSCRNLPTFDHTQHSRGTL